MVIPDIIKYVRGFLTLKVEGLNIERFLNMAVSNGIDFWDIKRNSITEMKMKVSIGGYRKLKKVLRKTGCRVSILEKEGLPFFIIKAGRRKMLGIGLLIFLLILFALSSFVWSVKVVGTKNISTVDIENNLSELGVRPGAYKLSISVSEIEDKMLIKMGGLSWIKVRLTGTRVYVEVKERTVPPSVVPDEKPCNIVAKRDGTITKIVSQKGDTKAVVGETVTKGQLLVTGIIERENLDKRLVHASGEVMAKTWYECNIAVPFEKLEKIRTGRKSSKTYLKWYDKSIIIKNINNNYKSYDKIVKSAKLIDLDRFQFPLEIVIEEYWETAAKRTVMTPEEAKIEAGIRAEKFIIDNMPADAKIIDKKIDVSINDNAAYASVLLETIENIGIPEEII